MDVLDSVRKYLQKNYPNLPPLTDEQIMFLIRFAGSSMGRTIRFVSDPHLRKTLWLQGHWEHLHVPAENFTPDFVEKLIPDPYRMAFHRMSKAFHDLYYRDKLGRFGQNLLLTQETPITAAFGTIHHSTFSTWPLSIDQSGSIVVLQCTDIHLHRPWNFQRTIDFRPMLFIGSDERPGEEEKLVKIGMRGILDDLQIEEEWLPVLWCHFKGVANSQQIAKMVQKPLSTVNYYNTKLLEVLKPFSSSIRSAREGIDFLKAQGLEP